MQDNPYFHLFYFHWIYSYHLLSPNTPMTVAIPNSPNINSFSVHGYLDIDHQRRHKTYGGGKKGKHKHKHMVWTTQASGLIDLRFDIP